VEKQWLVRHELIELIEQERRYALFGKNLDGFWRLRRGHFPILRLSDKQKGQIA
jgi:mRNA-degrading endonuclease RelE of RelBE toxin-antitoxin system